MEKVSTSDIPEEKLFCSCGAKRGDMQRVPRNFLQKNLLFFLPIKRYKCMRCMRHQWTLN